MKENHDHMRDTPEDNLERIERCSSFPIQKSRKEPNTSLNLPTAVIVEVMSTDRFGHSSMSFLAGLQSEPFIATIRFQTRKASATAVRHISGTLLSKS